MAEKPLLLCERQLLHVSISRNMSAPPNRLQYYAVGEDGAACGGGALSSRPVGGRVRVAKWPLKRRPPYEEEAGGSPTPTR